MAPVIDTSLCLNNGLWLIPKLIEILTFWTPIQDSKILYDIKVLNSQRQFGIEDGICLTHAIVND